MHPQQNDRNTERETCNGGLNKFYIKKYICPPLTAMLYTLEFPSGKNLRNFVDTLSSKYSEINYHTLLVICECSEEDLERAVNEYGATIVKKVLE